MNIIVQKQKVKDRAFISIKIPQEALPLLEYASSIPNRYSTIDNLNRAISEGMAILSKTTKIPELEFYCFRHSVGNHARNTCRKSKDDVALALNHVDQVKKTTDIYIKKDWSIIDEVQEAVISLIRPKLSFLSAVPKSRLIWNFINLPNLTCVDQV